MTRAQRRAQTAHDAVLKIKAGPEQQAKRYATVVYEASSLVRTAGLVQALHFIHALSNDDKNPAGAELLDQLGQQIKLGRLIPGVENGEQLLARARKAELAEYLLLSREVIAALVWHRRFVQALLKISAAEARDRS